MARAVAWLAEHATSEAEREAHNLIELFDRSGQFDDTDLCFDMGWLQPPVQDVIREVLHHVAG
jgi:hypothetical protein